MSQPNSDYMQLVRRGPFPDQIDPWVEQARYFHQLHGQMIGYLIDQINEPLIELGYIVGREASVQIWETSIPDVLIQTTRPHPPKAQKYTEVAATMELELGVAFSDDEEPELDAVYIKSLETGQLVTIVEIVSPSNKTKADEISKYQTRRRHLLVQSVNIVEIDFTRSVKRLITTGIAGDFPYHIALHLHDEDPRLIGMALTDPPKKFGLPLRTEVIPLDLNPIYRQAYERLWMALRIHNEQQYSRDDLPFPSLLSDAEHKALLETVKIWQEELKATEK